MKQVSAVIEALLVMNMDCLAAKVRLGANAGDATIFLSDETELFTVRKMFEQVK